MTAVPFKVIIVGASVAGLTLAHCLERAGIDYIVLEKHHTVAETVLGGFLVVQPNGAQVLSQLGLYDAVRAVSVPLTMSHVGHPDGFEFSDSWPARLGERIGFSLFVLRRQELLHLLYTNLPDRSKVLTDKKVIKIDHTDSGVFVSTEDGTTYYGDTAVGADGIHSVTRSELWRMATSQHPGLISTIEQTNVGAEWSGIVGMSPRVPGIEPGEQIVQTEDGQTIFVFGGKSSVGWLIVQKLDRRYCYPHRLRYTQEDAVAACEKLLDRHVWRDVKFGDIYRLRETLCMVSLEEMIMQHWHYRRVVCIGDSVNKMTPNFAQGANSAIEHAAALANELHRLVYSHSSPNAKTPAPPTEAELSTALEKHAQKHYPHLRKLNRASWNLTRMQARQGWLKYLGRYVLPKTSSLLIPSLVRLLADSVALEYLPRPDVVTARVAKRKTGVTWSWVRGGMVMMGSMAMAFGVTSWLRAV